MYADKNNVEIGDFVIISSSIEDPDNAKLYIHRANFAIIDKSIFD